MSDNPFLNVYVGPMFSGKTSRLLAELDRSKYQHRRVMLFKPRVDNRFSADEVVSHNGLKCKATVVETGADIIAAIKDADENPSVVAVDEAFMIDGVAEVLIWLYRMGYTVLVSTLDMSSQGKPFAEVEKLLPWATHVEKCCAVCTVCGRDARYTHKKTVSSRDEIEVGGDEMYEARCFSHTVTIDLREKV